MADSPELAQGSSPGVRLRRRKVVQGGLLYAAGAWGERSTARCKFGLGRDVLPQAAMRPAQRVPGLGLLRIGRGSGPPAKAAVRARPSSRAFMASATVSWIWGRA